MDWSGYADDFELYFNDAVNLEMGLVLLNETFIRIHLQINVSKTKRMIVNYKYIRRDEETYPESITSLNGKPLKNVKIFTYFGDDIKFNESSTGNAEIDTTSISFRKGIHPTVEKTL